MAIVEARGLRKSFGKKIAVDGIDFRVDEGRIVGLLGANGAGKTTVLNSIVGLTPYEGELTVLGRDPWATRAVLMRDVSFIGDVAILPRWMRVSQLLDYMQGIHPRFDRVRAEHFLRATAISLSSKVRQLSKGMVTQLHLALVMAIDARLLALDEPTLGLDLLFRKQFYDALLTDYFEGNRTIILATHQLEEVQHVLTDLLLMHEGRLLLQCSVDEAAARFVEVMVPPDRLATARALGPLHERETLGGTVCMFEGVDRRRMTPLGDLRTPGIPDLFVALAESARGAPQREAR